MVNALYKNSFIDLSNPIAALYDEVGTEIGEGNACEKLKRNRP